MIDPIRLPTSLSHVSSTDRLMEYISRGYNFIFLKIDNTLQAEEREIVTNEIVQVMRRRPHHELEGGGECRCCCSSCLCVSAAKVHTD